jgi:hypothetical protein
VSILLGAASAIVSRQLLVGSKWTMKV